MRQETMVYVGLDVHKEFCQACVIDPSGRVLSNEKFSSTQKELDGFLRRFKNAKFVLESTGIWEFIYEGIEKRGFEVVVAHPLKVRAIAEAKVKTDKVDAETLAQLLRADLIPRSWVPSKDMRDLRQLVRQRAYLVQRATGFKNRISAELLRRGVRRPEDSAIPPEETVAPAARTACKRRPGSAKVTTVPVEAPAKATGRTNGISYVNGLGRASDRGLINGTSVVNGTGFVNGAGPSTGTGRREEGPAARRASRPIRWQLLAALMTILIIIPAFIFLSYSNIGDEFSVDGDYSDWDGATTYGIRIQAPAPSSVITEWAVGAQSSDLFLYFRAESQIMSSPIAECYYLFVDSNGSNSTGYIIESTGADYML